MIVFQRIAEFSQIVFQLMIVPENVIILFISTIIGIVFGALPGLTATLAVALLTTVTYGFPHDAALIALIGAYVGAIYGGSYASITINIPGTAASAATALDGYPLALKGEAGKALGLTTTASMIGTLVGMLFLAVCSPIIAALALQFTSFEFFLLAFFGILISGSIASPDLVTKGWIAGLIGLFLAMMGRDNIQAFPRFTFGFSQLEGGVEVVPVLIGAFGIPQIIDALKNQITIGDTQKFQRVFPEFKEILKHIPTIIRSSLIGVGIGAVPGIGEDIAAWVSYSTAKNSSEHPEKYGKGEYDGIVASEVGNNACIGGAIIPLLTLGIPGSPPAAMLLGALLIHNVAPGPLLSIEHPEFILKMVALVFLAAIAMFVCGILLAKQVVKVLRIPLPLLMPIVGVLCVTGSYALGLKVLNLYLMIPIGILAYFMTEMGYPVPPMVIGVILGPMCDENLRRALMVSKGSFLPIFTRPVALILFAVIIYMIISQIPPYKRLEQKVLGKIFHRTT